MKELAVDPGRHFTTYVVGNLFFALRDANQQADATVLLEAGLQLFPRDAFLLLRMGEAELARSNLEAARRYFERALAADPLAEGARVQLERLSGR